MATYKYQQNMFTGASEGYVKYNITPDFGTPLVLGDTLEISGVMYSRDHKVFGIQCETQSFAILGSSSKTASKGSSASFTMTATVTQILINKLTSRAQNVPIIFTLFDSADLNGGSQTQPVNAQSLYVFKSVLSPVLSNISFSDASGTVSHFGAGVQNRTEFIIDFDYQLDDLFTGIDVASVSVSLSGNALSVKTLETTGNHAKVTMNAVTGIAVNGYFAVTLVDTNGASASLTSDTAVSVYAYSPPYIATIGSVDLARRYDYKPSDYGDPELVLLPEGKYLMLNFNASVTSIAGKNAWTIKTEFADADTAEPSWTTASTTAYADGQTLSFVDNVDLIGEAHTFSSGLKYLIRVTVTDFFESASLIGTVDKATGYFQITKYGISMGRRSSATSIEPKTESEYPLYPYAGIRLIDGAASKQSLAIADGASFTYYNADADIVLTSYGNLVSLSGIVKPTKSISGSNTLYPICKIPEEYAPTGNALNILQQGTDRAIWLLTVSPKDDPNTPCQVSFSRYRNGSSSAQVTTSTWLPFYAFWIAAPKELVVQTSTAIAGMALAGEVYCGEVE